jgi:hypothetical protein
MIAPCGIICTDCPVYKAALDKSKAEVLAEQWKGYGYPDALPEWFKCQGCHGDDSLVWGSDCEIRDCCIKTMKLDNCSSCEKFPCELIEKFENDGVEHHKAAVEYLKQLRENKV